MSAAYRRGDPARECVSGSGSDRATHERMKTRPVDLTPAQSRAMALLTELQDAGGRDAFGSLGAALTLAGAIAVERTADDDARARLWRVVDRLPAATANDRRLEMLFDV